uniref:NAD(P)/FAD-dependent oxidoreductase n=1 Tax=Roseovarius indicus TaxID=540747 RepID=UPI003B52FE2D
MVRTTSHAPKHQVYWLDDVGPGPEFSGDLPASTDVLIVGSGYTGLNAAIETARGGRSTLVLDADDPGYGCSTRNGGQISTSIKPTLEKLTSKFGEQKARAIRGEGSSALSWIEDFVRGEEIDCDFRNVGRFHAAHTPESYETLARDTEKLRSQEGIESFVVPRDEQKKELGTNTYHGGVVFTKHCSLHPAKYHRGLLRIADEAGARILGNCRVTAIERTVKGFNVITEKGRVEARDVIVATNGYTTNLTPWQQRRVIPIGSYIIATEELPEALVDELFPTDRIASDTFKVLYYYRASPDRRRILFGGRVSAAETDPKISGPLLYESMCRIFPQLKGREVTHSWAGTVAYSFDELPHAGTHDGVHYAMGYCGSGVSMASYLGMRTGQKVLGKAEGKTAFEDLPFPTRPLYTGKPWFLPAAVAWYRWMDTRQYRRAVNG